jgi:hypothetical protein
MWFFSLFSGLEYCFKLCRDDCNVNMRLLNGHSKATAADVRYYSALTCFSALVAESAAAILLEDDRFLLNNVEVKEAMQTEIAYIQQVDARVFEYFMPYIGGDYTATSLRSDAITAAYRMFAFAEKDAFRQLDQLPWRLTQGDINANVRGISEILPPFTTGDSFTDQMCEAIACGMPQSLAVNTLKLVREAPCTTNMIEQAHGLGSSCMGAHSGHSERSLQARSLIHQSRVVFEISPDERRLQRLDARVDALHKLIGKRFGCNELLVQKLSASFRSKNVSSDGFVQSQRAIQTVATGISCAHI